MMGDKRYVGFKTCHLILSGSWPVSNTSVMSVEKKSHSIPGQRGNFQMDIAYSLEKGYWMSISESLAFKRFSSRLQDT